MGQRTRTGSRWLWLTMVGLVLVVGLGLPLTLVLTGLVLSLAGGALQASTLTAHVIWEFNHNGLYHLVQLAGVVFLLAGLRGTLSASRP